MTVSWLAGGSYHSIRALAGVSKSEFYYSIVEVMEAICAHPQYQITAPVYDWCFDSACSVRICGHQ
ncbi:hypothetical protein PC116_g26749 [Phytophthora cactorum]|nr:hypothetical protein PC116_g26749 [Phytophthora cactorum]